MYCKTFFLGVPTNKGGNIYVAQQIECTGTAIGDHEIHKHQLKLTLKLTFTLPHTMWAIKYNITG